MNTSNHANENNKVALNSTFMRLSTGELGIGQVIAKRNAERAALRTSQPMNSRRIADFSDPFLVNHCH